MHIAVASVHMQGDPDTALEHALVNRVALVQDGLELRAREYVFKHSADLRLPTRTQTVVLQLREKCVAVIEPLLPSATHIGQHRTRLLHALFQQLGRRHIVGVVHRTQRQVALGEECV